MKMTTFKLAIVTVFSLILVNAGSLRCESRPENLTNARSQPRSADAWTEESRDPNMQEAKSARFMELEWIIKQRLMQKYQELEKEAYEDMLD